MRSLGDIVGRGRGLEWNWNWCCREGDWNGMVSVAAGKWVRMEWCQWERGGLELAVWNGARLSWSQLGQQRELEWNGTSSRRLVSIDSGKRAETFGGRKEEKAWDGERE